MNEKHLYSSLGSGETSGSFTDETIIDSSVIEIYFDNTDCYLDSIYQNGHTVYYTVGGNATGTNVCLCIDNLSNFVPYDDEGISARVDELEEDIQSINTEIETLDDTLNERVPDETLLGGVLYHGTTGNTWKKLNANNLDYDENITIYSAMGNIDELPTTSKNLVGSINEVFQNVSNGKSLIADAITDKGVSTSANDTFSVMATNINNIPSGGGIPPHIGGLVLDKEITEYIPTFNTNCCLVSHRTTNGVIEYNFLWANFNCVWTINASQKRLYPSVSTRYNIAKCSYNATTHALTVNTITTDYDYWPVEKIYYIGGLWSFGIPTQWL